MIRIGKPYIEETEAGYVRLASKIYEDNEEKTVWAETDKKFTEYLCTERSDAFVIGLLHYAITNNHDIVCEAPMSEDLYYQINSYLIDALAKGSDKMHPIKIEAEIDNTMLPCANKVGTGISCGIDSFHVLANISNYNKELTGHKITNLTFNNVGSHGEGEYARKLYAERKRRAESFCKEYGFEFTYINSNIMDEFKQSHYMTHTFTSMFAVFALQKLYSIYFYASGRSFAEFSLKDTNLDCSYYDLLLADVFSVKNLRIYMEGSSLTRLEKTKEVVNFEPSYRYLNVCTATSDNCSRCEKCTRTLLALDVLNALDSYKKVFDIDYYRKNRQDYFVLMVAEAFFYNNFYYKELYPYLRKDVNIMTYFRALWYYIKLSVAKTYIGKKLLNLIRK